MPDGSKAQKVPPPHKLDFSSKINWNCWLWRDSKMTLPVLCFLLVPPQTYIHAYWASGGLLKHVCMYVWDLQACMYVCLRQLSGYVCMSQTYIHTSLAVNWRLSMYVCFKNPLPVRVFSTLTITVLIGKHASLERYSARYYINTSILTSRSSH